MGLLVTVALHPNQYLPSYDHVDRVHVMTYDIPRALHFHARYEVVTHVLNNFKLIAGIPAYARHEVNPGLVKIHSEIIDTSIESLNMSNIHTFSNLDGYLFDCPASIQKKVDFVKRMDMGSIFFLGDWAG